jgi:hypothetical protein
MDEVRMMLGSLLLVPSRIEDEVVHVEVMAFPLTLVTVHTMAMEVEVVVDTTMGIIAEVEDTATTVKMAGVEEAGVEVEVVSLTASFIVSNSELIPRFFQVPIAVPEDFLRHGPARPPKHKICSTPCLYHQCWRRHQRRRRCWLLVCRHETLSQSDIINMHGCPFPHYCLRANLPSSLPI